LETSFGAEIGSDTMRLATARAVIASNTALDNGNAQDNMNAAMNILTPLQDRGLLNSADVAGILKTAPGRIDRGGQNGYGALIGQADRSLAAYQQGGRRGGELVTEADSARLLDEVVDSVDAGNVLSRAHIRGVRATVPRYAQRVMAANDQLATAQASVAATVDGTDERAAAVAAQGNAERNLKSETRRLMNIYDQLNFNTSPDKQDAVAESIMSAGVRDVAFGTGERDMTTGNLIMVDDGSGRAQKKGIGDMITMRELMERARSQAKVMPSGSHVVAEGRREYPTEQGGGRAYGSDYETRLRMGGDDPDGG
jgi:hypothetical protein